MSRTHHTDVAEVGPDIFKLTTYLPDVDLQFSQVLVRDDEPLLFHTGMRALFPSVREAVARVLPVESLRWVSFSHFEADESGALNEWLTVAPQATAACSFVGAMVSVNDQATRPARPLQDDEVLVTGRRRFRFLATPHVPHAWDAGLLFEETTGTLLCSDLLHQSGDVEAVTSSDVLERVRSTLVSYQQGPFHDYLPYTRRTGPTLERLAGLGPQRLVTMHGSTFEGDGARVLRDLDQILRDVLTP